MLGGDYEFWIIKEKAFGGEVEGNRWKRGETWIVHMKALLRPGDPAIKRRTHQYRGMKFAATWRTGDAAPKWGEALNEVYRRTTSKHPKVRGSGRYHSAELRGLTGGGTFGAGDLRFQLGDVEDNDLPPFQADDASVHKAPQVS